MVLFYQTLFKYNTVCSTVAAIEDTNFMSSALDLLVLANLHSPVHFYLSLTKHPLKILFLPWFATGVLEHPVTSLLGLAADATKQT